MTLTERTNRLIAKRNAANKLLKKLGRAPIALFCTRIPSVTYLKRISK